MQKTATTTTRKPAPKAISHGASSPPLRRRPNVAFRDNQLPQKENPKAVGKTSETVLDMAAVEPLKAAKLCRAEISATTGGFHEEMRRHIAAAYAVARALQNNSRAWRSFIEEDFWQRRKRPPKMDDRKAPLLPVMEFVFNAIDRNRCKRASKYAAGLQQYWIDNVPAQKVEARIKQDGGIEALYEASAKSNPKKKPNPEQSPKLIFSATEGRRRGLLELSEGQEARLIIRRVTGERGVVARIVRFDLVKA